MDINNIELQQQNANLQESSYNLQKPKNVLYFSDGIVEDFSENEDNEIDAIEKCTTQGNTKSAVNIENEHQTWGPYLKEKSVHVGSSILSGIDYAGEKLASFFGIITSKYASEIEEFHKIQEEINRIEKEEREQIYWQDRIELNHAEVITKENKSNVDRY